MRTVIVDANNLAHIQRHAFGDDLSHDDELTGIMWGFFYVILRLARDYETDRFVFAWDSRKSYRRLIYPAYKAHRKERQPPMTDDQKETERKLFAQFDRLRKELLPGFGFRNNLFVTGLEADDIIASVVLHTDWDQDGQPVVVSTDKDLFQLLDHCDVFRPLPGEQKHLMTSQLFHRQYGIGPQYWVSVRAIEGDPSDNIPGIQGVGTKIAIRYVKGDLPVGSMARVAITSDEGQSIVQRNTELMTLPHPRTPRFKLTTGERFDLDYFLRMCDRYNFQSFLKTKTLAEWRQRFRM